MRLGVNGKFQASDPEEWVKELQRFHLSTAILPFEGWVEDSVKEDYFRVIRKYHIPIGEVGVWRNMIAPDRKERSETVEYSIYRLGLAEEIGAGCCVNISGSTGENWAGYYPDNFSKDTYALVIDTVRSIVDAVKPKHTCFALEPSPWIWPDSPDNYLKLLKDIDRKEVGVHLDACNMISGMDRYLNRNDFLRECFHKLGPYIKSIHAKDICLGEEVPCCLRENIPGRGEMDFTLMMELTGKLGSDIPVFVEHMESYGEYEEALGTIRKAARKAGVPIKEFGED